MIYRANPPITQRYYRNERIQLLGWVAALGESAVHWGMVWTRSQRKPMKALQYGERWGLPTSKPPSADRVGLSWSAIDSFVHNDNKRRNALESQSIYLYLPFWEWIDSNLLSVDFATFKSPAGTKQDGRLRKIPRGERCTVSSNGMQVYSWWWSGAASLRVSHNLMLTLVTRSESFKEATVSIWHLQLSQ